MTTDFHSIDEVAMFVTAVNVVDSGELHANQIGYSLWGIRPGEEVTMLDDSGDIYTKKSPLMIFLMVPLVLLGRALSFLALDRAVLWIGPLLTTIIACILYQVGRKLKYDRYVSVAVVGLLILGTMMLPYAQTTFGELVATIGLLLTIWASLHLFTGGGVWAALGAGFGLALACGVNPVYFALAAVVALLILLWQQPTKSWRPVSRQLLIYALPVVIMAATLFLYNYLRFGSILETGYHFRTGGEGFNTPLWWGALGLTISPARGLLWYSPPVILAIFSWPSFHRRQRRLSWLLMVIVLFHIVAFGMWWSWWGGYGWGPRFLLPIVPLLLVVTLPGLDRAKRGSWPWRLAVLTLLIAGIGVQVAGVTIDPNLYEQHLDAERPAPADQPLRYHHDPALVFDVNASPILYHWRQIGSRETPWQLGWWRDEQRERSEIVEEIRTRQRPGDSIVLLDLSLQEQFLEAPDLPPNFGLPVNVAEDDTRAQMLWRRAQRDAERVWLVTWYPPADDGNWYERQLSQRWASESGEWFGERRLLLASRPLPVTSAVETDVNFGPLVLSSYHLAAQDDRVGIEMTWMAPGAVDDDYVMFVHLADEKGQVLAQQDRQPLGGYLPTSQWQAGEQVTDRLAFDLPEGIGPGEVTLRIGWYSWPDLVRLPVVPGRLHETGDLEIVDNGLVLRLDDERE